MSRKILFLWQNLGTVCVLMKCYNQSLQPIHCAERKSNQLGTYINSMNNIGLLQALTQTFEKGGVMFKGIYKGGATL